MLHLCFESRNLDEEKLKQVILNNGFKVYDTNISRVFSTGMIVFHFMVKTPKKEEYTNFIESLKTIGNLTEFSITD